MRNLNIAIRSLFKKGRHNVMKIISLSVGLSVALVMIAKIYFEQSYDTFYPDADRIYRIYENYSMNGKEEDYYQVSGAVAPLCGVRFRAWKTLPGLPISVEIIPCSRHLTNNVIPPVIS